MEHVSGLLVEDELPLLQQPDQLPQALPDGLWQHPSARGSQFLQGANARVP